MIIPSLFPRETARFVSYFRGEPEDPLEIAAILSYLGENNWRRFLTMELLKGRFSEKVKELESRKCEEWRGEVESQKELLEKRKLTDDEILHIEAGKELKKRHGNLLKLVGTDRSKFQLNKYEEEFIRIREEKRGRIHDLRAKYEDFSFWALKNRNLLKYIQERIFSNRKFQLSKIKDSSKEWALIHLWGLKAPERYQTSKLYENLLLYINLVGDEKTLIELAIALSSHEKSLDFFDKIMKRVENWLT
ncbi:MAG TPA: hypothetical protein PLO64_03735 [Methanothermobacter sp.]|nr:hypothetical protein [Methanothermobacter sp.]HOK72888.1 hypothetical protein [Methanothermobacter sp.]HOL69026.1 hypothetical protein [Methanothermobacter sp.]HPQ04837.1 hypothetical protein [Methanothermobacter sp.]HPU36856.1 hypothetical protein [Methanothermobacter sp.]